MADQWRVESLRPFSSRSSSSEGQTFSTFRTVFDGVDNATLAESKFVAQEFAEHPDSKWLVISGTRGNGKSHLCAAVDNRLRGNNVASLFITMSDLLSALKASMDQQGESERNSYSGKMQIFKSAPVLILDDVGAENSTPFAQSVLFEIIDFRYRNRLPTMIVTNVPFSALDARVASRMQDTSLSEIIENNAPDFRRRPVDER